MGKSEKQVKRKYVVCVGEGTADLVIDTRCRYSTKQATNLLLNEDGTNADVQNEINISVGGTVVNVAVALATLGEETRFFGKFGKDPYGQFTVNGMKESGVDTTWCLEDENRFSNTVIFYIDEDGDRDGFIYPTNGSACAHVFMNEIPKDLFENVGILFTTGISLNESPICETVFEIAKLCKRKGIKLVFDISLRSTIYGWTKEMREKYMEFMELCDIILGSGSDEIAVVTGISDPEAAAKSMVKNGKIIVCKSGANGAALYSETESYTMPAFPVKVQDTIGAGDTFNGGFIAALNKGYDLKTAILWGSAAAAYSIQFEGACKTPDEKTLLEFIERYKLEPTAL